MKKLVYKAYILTYFLAVIATFYAGEADFKDERKNEATGKMNTQCVAKKKINAVLFFADTRASDDYFNSSGIDYLKLKQRPQLKHCTDYYRSILSRSRRKTSWRFKRQTCSCYNRLQEGILSLMNYAQNTLGMMTALGSLSDHSFSNSIRFGHTEINVEERIDDGRQQDYNKQIIPNQFSTDYDGQGQGDDIPLLDKDEEFLRSIPLLNVFPKDSPPPFYAFTDSEERKKRSQGPYVMEPEHREVFSIKTQYQTPADLPSEISDSSFLSKEQKVKTIFDIMDVMNHLQKQLFGDVMEEDSVSDLYTHDVGGYPYVHHLIRRMRQPGLFEVVQKTLYSVINASDTGFLMIIIGGNLSDISSAYSPLVQSIKHVTENTDEDSTLIVLTGTCPNSPDAKVMLPCEELKKNRLPLFAIGPGSDDFSKCYELYDVPITVKNILTRYNADSEEVQSSDSKMPMHPRFRRNIKEVEDEGEDYYEDEEEFQYKPRRAAHTTGGGSSTSKSNQVTKEKGRNEAISHYEICISIFINAFISLYVL